MASGPITSWQIDGETVIDLFSWAPKSLWTVTAVMKLKDTGSLEVVQFSSVAQLCPTLCGTVDCSTSGFPVHHQLPKLTQTHVHQVGAAIQPSHPEKL